MKAVRFARHGKPEVLTVDEVPTPSPERGEALVRIEAASINPSDWKNVEGLLEQTTLPRNARTRLRRCGGGRTRGVGRSQVWGAGGDTGFIRDGSHAEYILVPVDSLRRKPKGLSFEQAASVGVNFITAWKALIEGADLRSAETVLIIAASGGVGNAAVQIAARLGATVIGTDRKGPRPGAAITQTGQSIIADGPDIPDRCERRPAGGAPTWCSTVSAASCFGTRWHVWRCRAGWWK